jgi:hypothetical protein
MTTEGPSVPDYSLQTTSESRGTSRDLAETTAKKRALPEGMPACSQGSSEQRATPLDLDQKSTHPGGGASPSERNAKLTHRVVAALVSSAGTVGGKIVQTPITFPPALDTGTATTGLRASKIERSQPRRVLPFPLVNRGLGCYLRFMNLKASRKTLPLAAE